MDLALARRMLHDVKTARPDATEDPYEAEELARQSFAKAEALYVALTENLPGQFSPEYALLCELTGPRLYSPPVRGLDRDSLTEEGLTYLNALEA